MMSNLVFPARNRKEVLRDPLSFVFSLGLPLFLLLLISLLQKSIQVEIFKIENFAPGIAVFSFSFITLFSGMLIAKDRSSSFLARLFASPMTAADFIIGYTLPLLPLAVVQSVICFVTAFFMGLPVTIHVLVAILALIPAALLFIGLGLLLGSVCNDKQVSGIASILVQVAALSSGMWFDLNMIGGAFKTICYLMPFAHALDAAKAALSGNYSAMLIPLLWVVGYTIVIFTAAIILFKRSMSSDNRG